MSDELGIGDLAPRNGLTTLAILVTASIFATPMAACDGFVVETNQEHFRRAVLAYEAVALDADFRFETVETWRGEPRDTLNVDWPRHHLDECEAIFPTRPGERYLVTIECNTAVEGGRFDCPARVDPVIAVPDRLRYLAQHESVSKEDLVAQLEGWLAGDLSDEELVLWASEMAVIGEVGDWQSPSGEDEANPRSYLGEVFHTFSSSFRHIDGEHGVDACERGHLAKTIVPTLLTHLVREAPIDEATFDELEELFDIVSDC